jgi:hypothetical protein
MIPLFSKHTSAAIMDRFGARSPKTERYKRRLICFFFFLLISILLLTFRKAEAKHGMLWLAL